VIQVRKAGERGHARHGWLESYHTFSFADYYDPRFMGFRALRVINEDRVQPGQGFGTHSHQDMEIISYVLDGSLEHRDSMGTGSVIRPHEFQRMSAGSGVSHSEFNASASDLVHFLQIWILPARKGIAPSYEQRLFPVEEKMNRLRRVVAPDGADGALTIHQDASVYVTTLDAGAVVRHAVPPGRHAWIQVARGTVVAGGVSLRAGDGAAVSEEREVALSAEGERAEALVFDLA
jgi:redox-sensitive bicupin YhaK (pirin superfamily)